MLHFGFETSQLLRLKMTYEISDLARDKDFLRLHRELSKFNVFHATGMSSQEIKHTQFLGYLLDPNESHGFKDEFLIRFLQSVPNGEGVNRLKMNLMDFNLSYAQVLTECGLLEAASQEGDASKAGGKVDLLIKIPSLQNSEKLYLIVIENKIRAKQGKDQLSRYRKAVEKECKANIAGDPLFLYLTISEEELDDEKWISVLYENTIIEAIENLKVDLKDTLSSYMNFLLTDYVDFITAEGGFEGGGVLEEIADSIHQEAKSLLKLISKEPHSDADRHRFFIRYKKAVQYFSDYDSDQRKQLLAHFRKNFGGSQQDVWNDGGDVFFRLESSNKRWMSFSFLSEENARHFERICQNPTRKGVASGRNLTFSLVIGKIDKDDPRSLVKCNVGLTLGPTGHSYTKREQLMKVIREAFNETHIAKADLNGGCQPHFSAVKANAYKSYSEKGELSIDLAKNWIDDTLKRLAKDEERFIQLVNARLAVFFEEDN